MPHCLITGANRGIGLALCRQLQSQYQLTAVCRQASAALSALDVTVISGIDMATQADLASLAEQINQPIDLLILNAGVWSDESLQAMDYQHLLHSYQVNAMAPLYLTYLLQQQQLLASGGKIAIITSRMGSITDNTSGGRYGYRMSKCALNAAGKSLSVDLQGQDISVGLIHPGFVQTDMGGKNAMLSVDESVTGIVRLIDGLCLANSGTFWHQNGGELGW